MKEIKAGREKQIEDRLILRNGREKEIRERRW